MRPANPGLVEVDDALIERVCLGTKRLLRQAANLNARIQVPRPWDSKHHFRYRAMMNFGEPECIEFAFCADESLGPWLAAKLSYLDVEECDAEITQDGINELCNLLAGQLQGKMARKLAIGLPSPGEVPKSGVLLPIHTANGCGALIIDRTG